MKKCDKDEKWIIVREGIQEYSKLPMRVRPMVIYIAKEHGEHVDYAVSQINLDYDGSQ